MIKINSQEEFDRLGQHVEDNIIINAPIDGSPLKSISGFLTVNAPCKANNLKVMSGCLYVNASFECEQLEAIHGSLNVAVDLKANNLKIIKSDLVIGAHLKADKLEKIGKTLTVNAPFQSATLVKLQDLSVYADLELSALKRIDGNLLIGSHFRADNLEEIGGKLTVSAPFQSSKLVKLKKLAVYADLALPELKRIEENLLVGGRLKADKLEAVGSLAVHSDLELKQLEKIDGDLTVDATFRADKLKSIPGDLVSYTNDGAFNFEQLDIKGRLLVGLFDEVPLEYKNGEFVFFYKYDVMLIIQILKLQHSSFQNFYVRDFKHEWGGRLLDGLLQRIKRNWDSVERLKIKRIFAFDNLDLRRFCFRYLQPSDVMEEIRARRIAVAGKRMNYFKYEDLEKIPFRKSNIYEVYEADAQDLSSSLWGKIHAVKVWCSSTSHVHWLWIDSAYKDDPLAAIASTFIFHENVIPEIKRLKRQGDIMLCEMKKEVIPSGAERPLTAKEYFSLLECET